MWVAIVVAGIVIIVWVWFATKPGTPPPAPPPPPPPPARDPADIENEINGIMPDFEAAKQDVIGFGEVNGHSCAKAVSIANSLKTLLDEYKDNPNMEESTYDQLKTSFEAVELNLSSWCHSYEEY